MSISLNTKKEPAYIAGSLVEIESYFLRTSEVLLYPETSPDLYA